MFKHSIPFVIALALGASLAGCAAGSKNKAADSATPVEKLYAEAEKPYKSGSYQQAIEKFEELESRYPYGRYAEQAQLNVAYSYYKMGESAAAVAAADRFIKLHPTHSSVDYAYYLRGIAYYQAIEGAVWDPQPARNAYDSLNTVVTRFPDSRYAADARLRMAKALEILGNYELNVAKYYFTRGAFVAAAERSKTVITDYQLTPAREEALALLARSYAAMGLSDLARDTAKILAYNYPNSRFLKELKGIPLS